MFDKISIPPYTSLVRYSIINKKSDPATSTSVSRWQNYVIMIRIRYSSSSCSTSTLALTISGLNFYVVLMFVSTRYFGYPVWTNQSMTFVLIRVQSSEVYRLSYFPGSKDIGLIFQVVKTTVWFFMVYRLSYFPGIKDPGLIHHWACRFSCFPGIRISYILSGFPLWIGFHI